MGVLSALVLLPALAAAPGCNLGSELWGFGDKHGDTADGGEQQPTPVDLGCTEAGATVPDAASPDAGAPAGLCPAGLSGDGTTCVDLAAPPPAAVAALVRGEQAGPGQVTSVVNFTVPSSAPVLPGEEISVAAGRNLLLGQDAAGHVRLLAIAYPAGGEAPEVVLSPGSAVEALALIQLGPLADDILTARLLATWLRAQPEYVPAVASLEALLVSAGRIDLGAPEASDLSSGLEAMEQRLLDAAAAARESGLGTNGSPLESVTLGYLRPKGIRVDWARGGGGDSCTQGVFTFQNPNNHYTVIQIAGPDGPLPIGSTFTRDWRMLAPFQVVPDVSVVDVVERMTRYMDAIVTWNASPVAFEPTDVDVDIPLAAQQITVTASDNDRRAVVANILSAMAKSLGFLDLAGLSLEDLVDGVLGIESVSVATEAYIHGGSVWSFVETVWAPMGSFLLEKLEEAMVAQFGARAAISDAELAFIYAIPGAMQSIYRTLSTMDGWKTDGAAGIAADQLFDPQCRAAGQLVEGDVTYDFEDPAQMNDWICEEPWHRAQIATEPGWVLTPIISDSYQNDMDVSCELDRWFVVDADSGVGAGFGLCTEPINDFVSIDARIEGGRWESVVVVWGYIGNITTSGDQRQWFSVHTGSRARFRLRFHSNDSFVPPCVPAGVAVTDFELRRVAWETGERRGR